MSTHLKTLIDKLDDSCRQAAERAASLCMAQGHYEVDLEHLLLALLEQPQCDLVLIAQRFEIAPEALQRDLQAESSRFRGGNTRTPVFSPHLPRLFEQGWLIASLDAQATRIRSGQLLLALLTDPELSQLVGRSSRLFQRFSREALAHDFERFTEGSIEAGQCLHSTDAPPASGEDAAAPLSRTPALDQFTTCLTQRAREGLVDPVIGRDGEVRQLIDILLRRRQNNPILTGEAGVGKTAVVEGLARRIAAGDVPAVLQQVELQVLDLGLLQAGASVKGEFENRLKAVIDEVTRSAHPIILFIDEAHSLIGAGGAAGQHDAANLLKPALARGELRTIAATTWSEYKRYFEKDAALARRFQVVKVEEPDLPQAAAMLRALVPLMERHFGLRVLDEAVTEAVRLAQRYVTGRQLPDKAVSVLDTACARVALGRDGTPAAIEAHRAALAEMEAELAALQREAVTRPGDHARRMAELQQQITQRQQLLAADETRLSQERALVTQILALRERLEHPPAATDAHHKASAPAATATVQRELDDLSARLGQLQGEQPMVPWQVDAAVVAEIVSAWTGVPLGRMVKDEIQGVRQLRTRLMERVIGQDHALEAIAQRVRTAAARLEDPHKPRGIFLFVGPSGVGKTETALALADMLYGGERGLVTLNMSEYQEAHSVSGLKGSPPGYVGYGEGGVLTEAVRRHPYSVVLLDEVEKAHPDVLELFFQVFDKGVLDDAEGREIDFRNTLIILTSNLGSAQIMQACLQPPTATRPTAEDLAQSLRPVLLQHFKPALLGRLLVVPYYPIEDTVLVRIIHLKLEQIQARIRAHHQIELSWSPALVEAVRQRCTEVEAGARPIDHLLNGSLLPTMADSVLAAIAEGRQLRSIRVGADKRGRFTYKIN